MTSRRGFFGSIAAALAIAQLDPEKLLWVPGAKTISVPKPKICKWVLEITYQRVGGPYAASCVDGADLGICNLVSMTEHWTRVAQNDPRPGVDRLPFYHAAIKDYMSDNL